MNLLPPLRTPALFLLFTSAALSLPAASPIHAVHYDAAITLHPDSKSLDGDVTIVLQTASATTIALDAEDLSITSAEQLTPERGPATYAITPGSLRITIPRPARNVTLRIRYHATPKRGVRFTGSEVVTYFNTPAWMPCLFAPSERATITLRVDVPSGYEVLANGEHVAGERLAEGRTVHTWKETRRYPAYIFGFAAGAFLTTRCAMPAGVPPVFLTGDTGLDWKRSTACDRLPDMFRFASTLSGLPYPEPQFTIAYADHGSPQEYAGFAVLSRDYMTAVEHEPREDYLLIHELSHAWWGNLITCENWSEFWLNEGLVTFVTALYKEQQWGPDEYDRERFLARRRVERARSSGKWHPLVDPSIISAENAGGSIPYSKGALFLDLLRHTMGDRDFRAGLREYTRHAGRGDHQARTSDFERALQHHTRRRLSIFFEQWARASEDLVLHARHEVTADAVVITLTQSQPKPWTVPLAIAVTTPAGRVVRNILMTEAQMVVRIPVDGPVESIRIDDGSHLPERVDHPRTIAMLSWQALHEPDALGRAEALETLGTVCAKEEAGCASLRTVFDAARSDRARVVQEVASQLLTPGAPH